MRIRHLADRVAAQDPPQLEVLHELGHSLEDHVRLEERSSFPLIEASLSDAELRQLVARLTH